VVEEVLAEEHQEEVLEVIDFVLHTLWHNVQLFLLQLVLEVLDIQDQDQLVMMGVQETIPHSIQDQQYLHQQVVGLEQHNHLKVDLEEQEDLEVEVFLEVPVIHLQQVLHKVIQEELQQESQKVELVVVEEELEQLDKMELHQKVVTEVQDQVVGQEIVH
jgi:hypothetical protein